LRCAGYLAWTSTAYKLLVRKPVFEKLCGTSNHRLENNIKMKPRDKGYEDMDYISLNWNRNILPTTMNIQVL
jgi:hypothetical protein